MLLVLWVSRCSLFGPLSQQDRLIILVFKLNSTSLVLVRQQSTVQICSPDYQEGLRLKYNVLIVQAASAGEADSPGERVPYILAVLHNREGGGAASARSQCLG